MKLSFFFVFYILVSFTSFSQIGQDVRLYVDSLPEKISKSSELAADLNLRFKNDTDRVAAVYYWMTRNIKLDEKEYFSDKEKYTYNFKYKTAEEKEEKITKVNMELAEEAFDKRICDNKGYVFLFQKLCYNVGLECEVIEGTLKDDIKMIGRKPYKSDYMWNAVKLGGRYYLVDVMRGAGKINNLKCDYIPGYCDLYFMADPEVMFLTHYPKNKEWLLIEKTEEDFTNLPLFHPYYFESKLRLIGPWTGVITEAENNEFKIGFYDKRTNKGILNIKYSYQSDMLPRRPVFISPNEFGIPVKKKLKDYVTIYYDNKPMVSYKIALEN